jgi:pyruvate dehydrogenase E2 component (dihydrolipoamide acetyltransferase)
MPKGGELMAKQVFIPKLGQTMEEVTITRWLVADGAQVEQGQEILEVETDKAIFAIEATARGVLHIGPYKQGDVVPVLTVVAIIGKPEDRFVSVAPSQVGATLVGALAAGQPLPIRPAISSAVSEEGKIFASPRAHKLAEVEGVDLAQVTPTGYGGQRVVERDVVAFLNQLPKATPVAQRMAAEAGVDLRAVTGTGPGGKITKEDVERAKATVAKPVAAPPAPTPLPEAEVLERVPLKGVRSIIAERMATSVHTAARVTLFMEADATEFVNMRERLKARVEKEWGFAPGYNDLLAKIVALALRQFPYMNARLTPSAGSGQALDTIERLAHINLGMATDTERGLLVLVIRDADKKSLRQFGQEFRDLVDRARNGKSLPDDLTGGTFTITNLGMYDVMAFTPIINLPEAAILGVGCITPRPVARNGQVEIRQMLTLSLAFDHRLVDGAPAARFLQYIKNLIEEPYLWVAA